MKRTYLIDSENINDIWVELLHCLEEKDEILVFYTDKSAHMGYDRIIRLMEHKRGAVRWLRCFEGQNALDFQLVTELGSRISQEPKREYIIVSNDTGYDAVVRYWQQKDYRVRRMKGVECEALVGIGKEIAEKEMAAEKAAALERESAAEKAAASERESAAEKTGAPESVSAAEKLAATERVSASGKAAAAERETAAEKIAVTERVSAAERFAVSEREFAAERELTRKRGAEADTAGKVNAQREADTQEDRMQAQESGTESAFDKLPAAKADSWRDELSRIFQENGSHDPQADMAFLLELCKTVKLSNMSLMHNVLEYHFGQTAGNAIYHFIKENPGCRGELSAGYSNNKKQRERQYLGLILKRNHIIPEEGDEEAILKILGGIPRKNLNSIHTALVKKFGQEEGGNCYAVLRNHVKIIRGL